MTAHKKKPGPWKVFIAIILGMLIGSLTQQGATLFGLQLYDYTFPVYNICGKIFINALTLVVVPLVSSSIITGIARIGNESAFGRLGVKTFGFYLGTSLLAILIGLFFVNILKPGFMITPESMASHAASANLEQHLAQETPKFADILLQIVPSNIVDTFSRGQMLGLIFFSLIFGYCISQDRVPYLDDPARVLARDLPSDDQIHPYHHEIPPLGVFFLVAKVFAEAGFKSLQSLGLFTLAVLLGLAVFMFIALPLLLKVIGSVRPRPPF